MAGYDTFVIGIDIRAPTGDHRDMTNTYALTITNAGDACTGDYPTYDAARSAAIEVAAIDGLTVNAQHWTGRGTDIVSASGTFVDSDDVPWFDFIITTNRVEK